MIDVTVVGASGFIGRYLYRYLCKRPSLRVKGTYCRSRTSDELLPVDITVYDDMERLAGFSNGVLVWLAGYKDIKRCERDKVEAERLNIQPVRNMVKILKRRPMPGKVLFISTDYVFDGQRGGYTVDDKVAPATVYGQTNAEAERILLQSGLDCKVVRTAAVMGKGGVFFDWLVNALRTEQTLSLFENTIFSPTPLTLLSEALADIIEEYNSIPERILHLVGNVPMSRYSFGTMIAQILKSETELLAIYADFINGVFQKNLSLCPSPYMERYNDIALADRMRQELECRD